MSIVTLLAQTFQYMYAGHICTGETGSFKLKASWNSFAWFLGSGPDRGRSLWNGEIFRPYVPRGAQELARQALDPASQASEPASQA